MRCNSAFVVVLVVLGAVLLVVAGCSGIAGTSSPGGSNGLPAAVGTTTSMSAQVVHVTLTDQQVTADRAMFYAG